MNENKKFHITITDNTTGETLVDDDAAAIIGAFDNGVAVACMGYTKCNAVTLAGTIIGAQRVIAELLDEHPELATLIDIMKSEN